MRPLVLAYHAFGERSRTEDPHNLFVPIPTFIEHLDLLLGRGWTGLDTAGFLHGLQRSRWPARSFFVTMDDGFVSTVEAADVLKARGLSALVFVPAGLLGASTDSWAPEMAVERLVDAAGVRELLGLGLEIGAHGWGHRPLTGMTEEELHQNTLEARSALTEVMGRPPTTFAYPGGFYDAAAMKAVERAGFAAAFAVERGAGRFALPRIDVNATDTARTFAMKCSRWWPAARAVGSRLPALRRRLHGLVGSAR